MRFSLAGKTGLQQMILEGAEMAMAVSPRRISNQHAQNWDVATIHLADKRRETGAIRIGARKDVSRPGNQSKYRTAVVGCKTGALRGSDHWEGYLVSISNRSIPRNTDHA